MKLTKQQIIEQWQHWANYLVIYNKELTQQQTDSTLKLLKNLSDQALYYYGSDFEASLKRPKYDSQKGYTWQ